MPGRAHRARPQPALLNKETNVRIRKAVIPAAGFGTRLYPATKAVKKELFPIVGPDGICRPALQYNIEEIVAAGIEQVCVIVQPGDEGDFRSYFSAPTPELAAKLKPPHLALSANLEALGRKITYAYQAKQEGYGHAVYCAREFVGDEPFLLLLGDHVFATTAGPSCTEQIIQVFEQYDATVSSVCRVGTDLLPHLGAIAGEPLAEDPRVIRVREFKEKPSLDYAARHLRVKGLADDEYYCHFGTHVFKPGIFTMLESLISRNVRERGEFQLTAAQHLLAQREPYYAYEITGDRYDIGLPLEYVRTVKLMARPG